MARIFLTLALALCGLAQPAQADCDCLYAGGVAIHGETVCIKTANGPTLARCEMVLNNSSWTILNESCDVIQSQQLTKSPAQSHS